MEMPTLPQTLRSTAYHEAGHAVIARVLDLKSGSATIVPDLEEMVAGHAMIEDPWTTCGAWEKRGKYRDVRTVYRGRIFSLMAGAETENELLGGCGVGDDDDRYRIMLALEEAELDKAWERHEPRMRARTRHLVRRHREKIERVANALLEHQTLQGDEIDTLCGLKPRQ